MNPVSEHERREYPDMVTPTELRNLAEALENSNHAAECQATLYKAAKDLAIACAWLYGLIDRRPPDFNEQLPMALRAARWALENAEHK